MKIKARRRAVAASLTVAAMVGTIGATTTACNPVAADNCFALPTGMNLHDALGYGLVHLDVVQHVCIGWDGVVRQNSGVQTQNNYGLNGTFGPYSARPNGSNGPQGPGMPNIAGWIDNRSYFTASWVIWGDATVGGVGYSHQVGKCDITWPLIAEDGGGGASVNRNKVFINFAKVHTQHPGLHCDANFLGSWTVSYGS